MTPLRLALVSLALLLCCAPASAAGPASPVAPEPSGRIGILPEPWVAGLERNNISEQTALVAGGAAVAALGAGVVAGTAAGGTVGATLFALWLAHLPLHIALVGSGG